MRGGFIHNSVLVDRIALTAGQLGFCVDHEVPIIFGGRVLYGDLVIRNRSKLILVEAELSSRRLANDLLKAEALKSSELWLVVPNPKIIQSVRRALKRHPVRPGNFGLFVFPFPHALQRLRIFSDLFFASNAETEKKCSPMTKG